MQVLAGLDEKGRMPGRTDIGARSEGWHLKPGALEVPELGVLVQRVDGCVIEQGAVRELECPSYADVLVSHFAGDGVEHQGDVRLDVLAVRAAVILLPAVNNETWAVQAQGDMAVVGAGDEVGVAQGLRGTIRNQRGVHRSVTLVRPANGSVLRVEPHEAGGGQDHGAGGAPDDVEHPIDVLAPGGL